MPEEGAKGICIDICIYISICIAVGIGAGVATATKSTHGVATAEPQRQDRAPTRHPDFPRTDQRSFQNAIDPVFEFLAKPIQPFDLRRVVQTQRLAARRHAHDIIIERPGMTEARVSRIKQLHDVAPAAKRAKRHAAADPLPQGEEIRADAHVLRETAVGEATGHDLVDDEHGAPRGGRVAQEAQESRRARDRSGRALHRFDEDGDQLVVPQGGQRAPRAVDVVVRRHDKAVRERHFVAPVRPEAQHAAVVAAGEHENTPVGPARIVLCGGDGQHVGLGAGVAEADELHDRVETGAEQRRETAFVRVRRAEVVAFAEGARHRVDDARVGVAEETGGVLGEEVDVGVLVGGGEGAAGSGGDVEGERGSVQDCARVTSREVGSRMFVRGAGKGMCLNVAAYGCLEMVFECRSGHDVYVCRDGLAGADKKWKWLL